jgi:hypothetical protein
MIGMMRQGGGVASSKDMEEFQGKVVDAMMEALNPAQMKQDVANLYSQLLSKEELQSMSDFYATPTGQSLLQKQPIMQQKMQEIVLPRMMAAMPKIK